jgi:hypothetical protein
MKRSWAWTLVLSVLVCGTSWAQGGYWKLQQSPETKLLVYPNGVCKANLEYKGGTLTFTTAGPPASCGTGKNTFTVTSPAFPEILRAGEEVTFSLQASIPAGPSGFIEMRGPASDVVYAGKGAAVGSKKLKIPGGDPNKDNKPGHFLSFHLNVIDPSVSSGPSPDGPPPAWRYEWMAGAPPGSK